MKRIVRIWLAAAATFALLVAVPAHAGSGAAKIEFGDNFFDPEEPAPVSVRSHGPEASWTRVSGSTEKHNIAEDSGLFSSGRPKVFESYSEDISAGTWHYYCRVHGSVLGGMEGSLAIAPTADKANGKTARIRWADEKAKTGNRYEVEFRVDGKKWRTWEAATKERDLLFGDGSPVDADPHTTYGVRVRSFASSDHSRRSDWSPQVTFSVSGQ